ncbi:MAG: hypothetical protein GY786_03595, partial [Proteobacteria bacterium]|nr:hypothetical protein [Pseudomonadota bacterium]
IEGPASLNGETVKIIEKDSGNTVLSGELKQSGAVDNWKDWNFLTFDFTGLNEEGQYFLLFTSGEAFITSRTFEIRKNILSEKTMSDVLYYFKSMRCTGIYEKVDSKVPVFESDKKIDAHGGWYDASGDISKYLSHLSYANFMNPQQIPMVGWNLTEILNEVKTTGKSTGPQMEYRLTEEILFGADFLMRMQDDEGFFYMTLFDQWSKDPSRRMLCSYIGQDGVRGDMYQAGYRQGGGVSIAMLARTSTLGTDGDYKSAEYLEAAVKGFDHLEENNTKYLDDGKENIIDDYCALLAASELYHASGDKRFYTAAEKRAVKLAGRVRNDENFSGWLVADDDKRPYFHAAEAGLPVLSLIRFVEVSGTECVNVGVQILESVKKIMEFELNVTTEVNNP